ncbi:acyl-CoA/acyl-ACP dehydrogenase [Sphingobium sp. JS3065]|uniref:acyl-CoA dehydrogenase family protein n=1 Tax=Sphingobium sp. JS3065 TaxID=2970925 RepID=UPI0022653D22|nr:acyl-CoA dehydrogenase family protein [Sphingobium sp. JS3065]UZW57496.1 acyl-CoA/acyl-ACP dehydrogenase [Sphingobium sp. JS3065]
MSYFLTEEQEAIRDVARRFTEKEVKPRALEIDGPNGHEVIRDLGKKMGDLGFFRLSMPESDGGMAAAKTTVLLVYEELAKESAALAIHLVLNGAFSSVLLGLPPAKEKWFEKVMSGDASMSASGTDPRGAANYSEWSDLAVKEGDHFILNGAKSYCSGAPYADLIVVFGLYQGNMWAFPIECGTVGFTVAEDRKMGLGTTFGALTLTDVRVPVSHCLEVPDWVKDRKLVGPTGKSAYTVLDISAMALGIAEGVFEKTLEYARERTNAGSPILSLGAIQVKFAKMKAQIEAVRNMLYNAVRLLDEGRVDKMLNHMVKPLATEMAVDVARDCMQIYGGSGYCIETGIERYLRDAMGLTIGEGSNDMHWSTVSAMMDMPGARPGSF